MSSRLATFALFTASLVPLQEKQVSTPDVLQVGHVIEVRGTLEENGRFVAQKIELEPMTSDDVLLGTVAEDQTDPLRFTLLGQLVETDATTEWKKIERASLAGQHVKVEGSWKGPRKFEAQSIEPRGEGRDRIAGRIDQLRKIEGGWEARVMIFTVLWNDDTPVEHAKPVVEYALAPERKFAVPDEVTDVVVRDEDDMFGKGIELSGTLRLLGQLELQSEYERNFDLNDRSSPTDAFDEDRLDTEGTVRLRLAWTPSEDVAGVTELRYRQLYRRDDDDGENDSEVQHDGTVGETWLQWRNVASAEGFDITVGRQDFDDPREWIYDQNLDALRLTWIRPQWRLDLSTSTTLNNGSTRDEESWNAVAYLSNNDPDRYLAAWTFYRRTDEFSGSPEGENSLHFGVRGLGEWLPDNETWAEFAYLIGERSDLGETDGRADVSTWAYDVGTTWSPRFAKPLYFTLGYALGRGDANVEESYRQTGYQDNNARFGGVTSFSYYGELFEPELSNLGISTLGVGARVVERTSVDLVFHTYEQDVAAGLFSPRPGIEANLDQLPNGVDPDLGWELDAIFGYRRIRNWDLELVAAAFEPGDGFAEQDRAYYAKFQLRYRF